MPALEGFETLATGLDHPEGIAVGPDGLLYAGGEAGQIYRVGWDGALDEIASTGGFIYGVAVAGSGDVFACDFGNAAVARVSATTGEVATYSSGTARAADARPELRGVRRRREPVRDGFGRVG